MFLCGLIVQGSEQAQPYKQGCKQPAAHQVRTRVQRGLHALLTAQYL